MPAIFLNEHHWAHMIHAIYREISRQTSPPGPLGQLWKLLVQANQHKRFTIEVENADAIFALGALTYDDETLADAQRAGRPKPRD